MIPDTEALVREQLSSWPAAERSYLALKDVRVKDVDCGGIRYRVQFNPARIVSSAAKVDAKSVKERRCFLCRENRPAEQKGLAFADRYEILVNPFPIFPRHLTIPDVNHVPQAIEGRMADMLLLAESLPGYVVFYNGPQCGASAPDHAHFQAGNKGFLPIEEYCRRAQRVIVAEHGKAALYTIGDSPRNTLVIESHDMEAAVSLFTTIYECMDRPADAAEPMMNIVAWHENGRWTVCIFPRHRHRPACYFATDDSNMLISPASVDMGGVFITPREEDFLRIEADHISAILKEVCTGDKAFTDLVERIRKSL